MKTALLALLLFASAAQAETVLRVPLFVEGLAKTGTTPMSVVNRILVKKGLPAQREYVELTATTDYASYEEQDKIDQVLKQAGLTNVSTAGELYPNQYDGTCFKGDINEVADLTAKFTDSVYSDQYMIHATKAGDKTWTEDGDMDDYLSQAPAWAAYDPKSDSALIISSVGDGGDDAEVSLIPRCK